MVASENGLPPVKEAKTSLFYFIACTMLACMTSLLLGYDIGVMSGGAIYIQRDLQISDVQLEILVGIINFCSLFGSLPAGRISDWIGRKYTTVVSCVIFLVGFLIMGFAPGYAVLMVGRVLAGIGMGFGLMIAPVYTAELAPAASRGLLASFPEIFVNVGILVGYISNLCFSTVRLQLTWRLMLGIPAIPSVLIGIGVLAMPESPRWLVLRGRLGDARKILIKTSASKEDAEIRLAAIKETALIPADCNDDIVQMPKIKKGHEAWKDLLLHPTKSVRHILIAALGIHFFQQIVGGDAVVLYSPKIFKKAGIVKESTLLRVTVGVGLMKTACIFVASYFLDKVGRRPLLLCSVGGMVLSVALLATGLTVVEHNPHTKISWAVSVCVVATLSYVGFFSLGLGPVTWVYSSEIFPLRFRALGMGMGVGVNRMTSGLIAMTFISLAKALTTGGAFYLFTGTCISAWLFIFFVLPETRGTPLEEMEDLFGGKHKKKTTNGT